MSKVHLKLAVTLLPPTRASYAPSVFEAQKCGHGSRNGLDTWWSVISQNGDWTEACYQSSLAGGSGWQLNLGELMPNNFHIFSMQRRIPIKKIQLHFLIIQIYLFIYSESFLNIRHFWKQVVSSISIYTGAANEPSARFSQSRRRSLLSSSTWK